MNSILDHPAISGRYLFPQDRCVNDPFMVEVDDVQLAYSSINAFHELTQKWQLL